tara:strand:- start:1383 stop:2687 length:1305 start_codon:yes stop_codon:yes gene_type:complete
MRILNDNECGWIKDLNTRLNYKKLDRNYDCDWLIIGAGYTGLSAARKLGELCPNQKIILVDAQLAGEGASSRNSGYLVDTTLNDGFSSNKEVENYKKKTDIYALGIKVVQKFIKEHQVDCDWNECGKYFASSKLKDESILKKFSKTLEYLNFNHEILYKRDLTEKLGTNFYNIALYTKGGILIHPAKLARAMIYSLPNNIKLFENTFLLNWYKNKDYIIGDFKYGKIKAKNIIFATNAFLKSLGIKKNYNFPITLTASMTRPLTSAEFKLIGEPKEWGVLPVRPLGATVRMTKNKRILIRNTAELLNPFKMAKRELGKRLNLHKIGIKKRFPKLPNDIIQSTWSGIVSRSRNSSQIFEKIDNNIFAAGCYNGSGIGVGTLFGEQIALKACNEHSKEIQIIENRNKPNLLPPEPFLNLGIKLRLAYEKFRSKSDI